MEPTPIVKDFASIKWAFICHSYEQLYRMKPDPIIRLNWIIALSYERSAEYALSLIKKENLEEQLNEYRWFYSSRASLLFMAKHFSHAMKDYHAALKISVNNVERAFLKRKIDLCKVNVFL